MANLNKHKLWAGLIAFVVFSLCLAWIGTPTDWNVNLTSDDNTKEIIQTMEDISNKDMILEKQIACYKGCKLASKSMYEAPGPYVIITDWYDYCTDSCEQQYKWIEINS